MYACVCMLWNPLRKKQSPIHRFEVEMLQNVVADTLSSSASPSLLGATTTSSFVDISSARCVVGDVVMVLGNREIIEFAILDEDCRSAGLDLGRSGRGGS